MSFLLLMDSPSLTDLVRAMFAANEQGIWLDPSDFSTLYQDASGTTPVTALGQPVGLALDKRLGLALGPELLVDLDPLNSTISTDLPPLTCTSTAGSGAFGASKAALVQAGKTYRVLLSWSGNGGGSAIYVQVGSQTVVAGSAASGSVTINAPTTATGAIAVYRASTAIGQTFSIASLSVREIAGNHAYQTTSAARQTAQSNYLSLDKTDDHMLVAAGGAGTTGFLLVAGIMVPAAGTARTLWSDRGTNTGYKVGIDASNQIFLSAGNGAAFVTATGPALVAGTKYVITAWHDGANLNISVNNGAPTQVAFVTATAGTATFTIGKSNGAATEYWGDRIYGMVYRKNDRSSAGQRSSLYSYMVGKMGGL